MVPHGVGNRFGVGPDGRMRFRRGRVLKTKSADATGHLVVTLSKLGKHPTSFVHVLAKEAFDGRTPEGMMVCHENGDPVDNRLENLYFGTAFDNAMDTIRHGTHPQLNKQKCPLGHDYVGRNILHKTNKTKHAGIRPSRECRACDNARCRRSWWKRTYGNLDGFDFNAVADSCYAKIMNRG